jgi:diacylglycerol O-acyltransferase / wax synthase
MARLPISDAAWLLMESRERPMHVAGLQVFAFPDDAPPTFMRDLAAHLRAVPELRKPFNQRLDRPYGRAGQFRWARDRDVDLEYHVRHSALPEPGRVRELFALVSRLHTTLLDRHRPLWESHLIEGLEGRRFALYTKVHHSVLDGVAAMRQVLKSFTPDPATRDLPPLWAAREESERRRSRIRRPVDTGQAAMRALGQVSAMGGAARALTQQVRQGRSIEALTIPYQAPRSILNTKLTGARRFAAQSWELDRIRAVSKATGATINDIVLTMCGSALRTYLLDLRALPDKPLVANVPVSIRPKDADDEGNALSFLLANLATHLPDPEQRLELVRESTRLAKQRLQSLTYDQLVHYAILLNAPVLVGTFTGSAARGTPVFNVVISNVPGPTERLYWNGAELQGMYPVSLIVEGQALNFTLTSYAGSIDFGLLADRKNVPHMQRLLDHLETALQELEKVAGL